MQDNKKIIRIPEGTDLNSLAEEQGFPIEVFPYRIQRIINATHAGLQFPIDFSAGSILFAASVAIGNTRRVKVMQDREATACLYITLVGKPGTNKTHPLTFFTSPITERDSESFIRYKREKQEYDDWQQTPKDQRREGQPRKPHWEKMLVSDITPEALADSHSYNLRGLGMYADELATWFKNFNRYHKGSEEQFWLSNWSGQAIRIDRKTGESIFIEHPFISVGGTIQTGVVRQLAKDRTENGFMDRILFVVPENLKKEYWGEEQVDPSIKSGWCAILTSMFSKASEVVTFSDEAFQVLRNWQRTNTDLYNEEDALSGVYSKLEIHCIRFALILHELRKACGEHDAQIQPATVDGAIRIAEYFRGTARRIDAWLNASPLDKLASDKRELYEALPQEFATHEGIEIAESVGVPLRTFEKFLKKGEFFIYVKRGHYAKRIK